MLTLEEKRQRRADYMRQYYHSRPEYREATKKRASKHYYANRDETLAANKRREAARKVANPELSKDRYRRLIEAKPEQVFAQQLRRYGMTIEEYQGLLDEQGGVCAICKGAETSSRGQGSVAISRLSVDHDHATGQRRGLLCLSCNMGIGNLENDRLSRLHRLPEAAAAYLGWARVWVEVKDIPKSPKAQAIIDGWLGGEHEDSLASRFGITRKGVYYHLKRNLTPMRELNAIY